MKLHILILTWNGLHHLENLREGLFENINSILKPSSLSLDDVYIYIRDNGSNDNTVKEISKWDNIKLFDIGHNRDNYSKGNNFLFEKANPADNDFILLLNNDIIFKSHDSLREIFDLQEYTKADIVGAKLLYKDNQRKLQWGGTIFSKLYGMLPYHYRHGEIDDENSCQHRYFQVATGACMIINAKAFKDVKGFDEKLCWCFDDVDLGLRIGKLKPNNIAYCGTTNILHEESASLRKNPINKILMNPNVSYFKQKWWLNNKPRYRIDHDDYLKNPDYRIIR
jgi:GT2 family glycosyltransferase